MPVPSRWRAAPMRTDSKVPTGAGPRIGAGSAPRRGPSALMLKGYRPLARRYAAAGGEIDLIVRRGRTIVFVEVKARARLGDASGAIDAVKRRRFSRAVRMWLSRHPPPDDTVLRAGAIFVAPRAWPAHVVDAFDIETR